MGDKDRGGEERGAGSGAAAPSFEQVVAHYAPLVSRIAASYEVDRGLREDLTQQIWLAIWQSLQNWRGEAPLKSFVARIAQNRAISYVSRQVRQPRAAELDDNLEADLPSPEEQVMEASERERLISATRRLPLPQREVIVLILEGFSYAEIAGMLDIAPNALALRLSRAKSALTKMMGPRR